MAIDFEQFTGSDDHASGAEPSMNITPLIDVLLVLLVMLIITIPVQLNAVSMDLPNGPPPAMVVVPQVVRIDVTADNFVLWNGEPVAGRDGLVQRLRESAALAEPPEIHVQGQARTRYDSLAAVLSLAQQAGLQKIGVIGLEAVAAPR